MISSLNASAQQFLVDLGRIQKTIGTAEQQLSSGCKVNSPSDAPDQISSILQLYADLDRNTQVKSNLGRLTAETGTAEQSLQTAVQLMDRAKVLASQGAGTAQSADTRASLAGEVGSLMDQLVAISNTVVDNRYIFGGDADQAPPYASDPASPNGVDRLTTALASRQILHPSGTSFAASKTAQEIFDSRNPDDSLATDNVFAAVHGLQVALAGNDQAGIASSLAALGSAEDRLNIQLAFYGTVQDKIADANDYAGKLDVRLQTELSSRRDADAVEAITELQRGQTQQQAALTARAQLPRSSLFDFLK